MTYDFKSKKTLCCGCGEIIDNNKEDFKLFTYGDNVPASAGCHYHMNCEEIMFDSLKSVPTIIPRGTMDW